MPHSINFRIYYEDTDSAGIVYYANYLKFAERARTEMIRELGINQQELMDSKGVGFVVTHVKADFKKPAKLDDIVEVKTNITNIGKTRITMQQDILKNDNLLVSITVKLAMINNQGKPVRLPEDITSRLIIA